MEDFRTYSPEEVITQNLCEINQRFDLLGEQEIAHLRELSTEIAKSADIADLLSALPYYRPQVSHTRQNTPEGNLQMLARSHKLCEARQCMILCHSLFEHLQEREPLLPYLFPDIEEIGAHAVNRIIYQRSSYADDAYLTFASLFTEPRAAYAHSFHAACEEVYNGHCEYCILPLENAAEGELIGFAKLISRYELKIAACCSIAGADTARATRFALLRRNILPALSTNTESNGFFRFSLPTHLHSLLGDILDAARFCELKLLTLSTLPASKGEADSCFHVTLSIDGGKLYPFLLYLAMVAPQYTPIGIYSQLKQKG